MDAVTKKKIKRMGHIAIMRTMAAVPTDKAEEPFENIDKGVLENRISKPDEDGYYDPTAYTDWLDKQIKQNNQLVIAELDRLTSRWFQNNGVLALACDCHLDTWHSVTIRARIAERIIRRITEDNEREQRRFTEAG